MGLSGIVIRPDAAVFHLGDSCTAARELWTWAPSR